MSKASDLARLMTSGSTAIHGEAGVTSSGSTGLTTNLQQGLAKAWWQLDGTGTPALHDSFNGGSVTDGGTGDYTVALTPTMGNTSYSYCFGGVSQQNTGSTSVATTSLATRTRDGSNSNIDLDHITCTIDGDLA